MTLKKALKYIDWGAKIRVWDIDEEDPIYEDSVFDFPKELAIQYRLVKPRENKGSEAMYPIDDGFLRITVIRNWLGRLMKKR